MKIQTVSREYFQKMIEMGSLKLCEPQTKQEEKYKIQSMHRVFIQFLNEEKETINKNISTNVMLQNLSYKMNSDLERVAIESWKNVQEMCWAVRKYKALDKFYYDSNITIHELIDMSLGLYKKASKEFYLAAKSVLEDRNTFIYPNDFGLEIYYDCAYLDNRFIACSEKCYDAYPGFIHELQHGVDAKLFEQIPLLYIELGPILFEILMCDRLNKNGRYPGIYGSRINNNNKLMNAVFNYVQILEKFNDKGRKLTLQNASSILGVETEDELTKIYNMYYYDDFVVSIKYIMSFMQAIRIRQIYYDSKKYGIKKLTEKLTDKESSAGYRSMTKCYEEFIQDVEKIRVKK